MTGVGGRGKGGLMAKEGNRQGGGINLEEEIWGLDFGEGGGPQGARQGKVRNTVE